MSFLAPLTLIGLLLLALPVLIHLLVRRRARRLDFPTLRFLRETPSFRLYPRHVRDPLLLALRILALLLLIMGLARPFISFNTRASRHTRVILIDASLSMRARGRAEAARDQARSIINNLSAGERAALIAFSSDASVLAEVTGDRDQLIEALKGYEPTAGAADYNAGLAYANTLIQQEATAGTAEVDLISDFQESNLTAIGSSELSHQTDTGARVATYAVGTEIERNAFLTDETLARGADNLVLSATEIVSDREGQSASRRNWTLDAAQGTLPDVEWRTPQSNGQIVGAAKANVPDDFDGDDNFFFAFTPPRESRALLIENERNGASLYLRAALEAATSETPGSKAFDRRGELPESAAELASYSLVVLALYGAPRAEEVRVLSEYAKAGGTVWLWCARDLDAESWSAMASTSEGSALPFVSLSRATANQPLSFGAIEGGAPALNSLNEGALSALRATRVRAGYNVTPRENAAVLMRWNDATPAFVSASVGQGSVLLLATSPERESSDLGLSPSLPALAHSILRAAEAQREPHSRIVGEPVYLGLQSNTDVTITDTEGHTTLTQARALAQQPRGVFREPGIYRMEFAGESRFLALNTPAAESARALAAPEEIVNYFKGKESAPVRSANDWRDRAERREGVWRIFLCAAFILLVAELFVSIRSRKDMALSDGAGSPAKQA